MEESIDFEAFDTLLLETAAEAVRREHADVLFWEQAVQDAGTERRRESAKNKLHAARLCLESAFHRHYVKIPTLLVPCPDPECRLHRVVFIAAA